MDEQPPLWDGTGVDPWLPERLAAEARIVEAEQRLYSSWWGTFTSWIVKVRRGVLAGHTPDPHAVWAFAPAWVERMTEFVSGPVRDTMGIGYKALFGPDYRFDARPAVARHLAEVQNRMVRTPDAVFDAVAGEVAKGAGSGESIPTIAQRVEDVLSSTATPTWKNRGITVARTEGIGSLNAGRADAHVAVAEELGGDFESQWLATIDSRVRPAHAAADGMRVPLGTPFIVGGEPLMQPGDPTGSAGNVIACRCSTLLVRPSESVDMRGRGFKDADEWWASQLQESR